MVRRLFAVVYASFVACSHAPAPAETGATDRSAAPKEAARAPVTAPVALEAWPLPGATAPVFLDYLVYEPAHSRVWVPVADSGSVAVFDVAAKTFARVGGFKTAEREVRGKTRHLGPTAAAVGPGFVYVGNRATNEVCAVDTATLTLGACWVQPSPIDGVAYVSSAREVWVTMPGVQSLAVLDAAKPGELRPKLVLKLDGEPEGYGADEGRGLFFTNLEDKDKTLAIDLATHAVRSTWDPGCRSAGPRGLAVDTARGFVVVACTDHLQVLDAGHGGARLGRLDTGDGVDNIDFAPSRHLVVVAAGKAARGIIARLDDRGQLEALATTATAVGARNVVTDAAGNAYVADPQGARLLVIPAPR